MAACLLILQYVSFELSYDQFNKNASDIYRVSNDRYQNGKLIQHSTMTYSAIGKAMQDDFPEVVNHTRVLPYQPIVIYKTKKIGEQKGLAVDNSFLSMFSYPLLAGEPQTALKEPNTVILSETLARKFFDIKDNNFLPVIGNAIRFQLDRWDSLPHKITGICKDVPENSHLQFDFLMSYATFYSGNNPWKKADYDFTDPSFYHYIQLKHGTDYKALEAKFAAFSQRYFQGNKVSGSDEKFYLQPLLKAHLYSDFEYEIGDTANSTVVWGLLIIAILIIVIAWVNYINLATAKSMERAKEVGVRKVSGATKQQLIKQFLTESFLLNIIALLFALLLVTLVQRSFNNLIQQQLSLSYLFQKGLSGYNISAALIAVMVAGILISGFYPAFVLSSFKPILVLKGKFTTSNKGIILRKVLVIGQFAVTVGLIIGSFVVYRQIQFVNGQNLGLNLSQILIVKAPALTNSDSAFITRANSFKNELKQIPSVAGAANSWHVAGNELGRSFNVRRSDASGNTHFTVRNNAISSEFIDLYNIKLLAGRNFTATDYNPDWNKLHNIIINESAVKLLGFTSADEAVGKEINLRDTKWDVVGVVADFHQKSLHYPIEPTILLPAYGANSPISVKVNTQNLSSTIAAIKKKYDAFSRVIYLIIIFLMKNLMSNTAMTNCSEKCFQFLQALPFLLPASVYSAYHCLQQHNAQKR